jgi:excisionase family DNA binding protein
MERLYTVEEAAEALRVARQTMYKYMDRGVKGVKLGYVYVGGERRITQGAIDAFIKASTTAQVAPDDTIDTQISASGHAASSLATA